MSRLTDTAGNILGDTWNLTKQLAGQGWELIKPGIDWAVVNIPSMITDAWTALGNGANSLIASFSGGEPDAPAAENVSYERTVATAPATDELNLNNVSSQPDLPLPERDNSIGRNTG